VLYEPCAYYSAHADKTYLWLAESYKVNEDATEWTITFRKGIQWSDGMPFTASDAAWSLETLKRVAGIRYGVYYASQLSKAVALDDITLKVTLTQPDWRFFFKNLTFRFDMGDENAILPAHIFGNIPDNKLAEFNYYDPIKQWPVSTGPYGVSESTDQFTHYDLRPSWWAADTGFSDHYPEVWRLRTTYTPDDMALVNRMIRKETDGGFDQRPLIISSLLVQADHISTWTGRKPPYGYIDWWPTVIFFCTAKPPFDNPKVRWAVAYALDQQRIVDIAYGGAGKVTATPFPEFPRLMKYVDGIQDLLKTYNVLEYNPEKSAALMQEAGYKKDAEGFWVDRNIERPDVNLYAYAALFRDLAPAIAEQLVSAGFHCEHKSPPDVWGAIADGRASMSLFGHGASVTDPYESFTLYRKENISKMGELSWGNLTRWSNDEFEAITDEMSVTSPDDPKMYDLFRRGMEIWLRELPACPLVQWYHRIPVSTWYWTGWPDHDNPYMNSAFWHLTMPVVLTRLKATGRT
jgi:peptide/nickel transport system substrate-binding protein